MIQPLIMIQHEDIMDFMNGKAIIRNLDKGNAVYAVNKKVKNVESPVTEEPIAEKDEVKKAEKRTQKLQNNTKNGSAGKPGKK